MKQSFKNDFVFPYTNIIFRNMKHNDAINRTTASQ